MKKKLLSLIAVSAALATAGSALIACGGDDKGDANASVTKEQWAAALSLSSFGSNINATAKVVNEKENLSLDYVLLVGSKKYGDYSITRTRSTLEGAKQDERTRIRIVGTDREEHYTRYSGLADDEGQDGEWEVGEWRLEYDDLNTYDDEQWESCIDDTGIQYICLFADKYDSFEYKNGVYTYNGQGIVIDEYASEPDPDYDYSYSSTMTATDIVVKFADGKLVYADLVIKDHSERTEGGETEIEDLTFKFTIKASYGAQTITAPEGAVEWTPPMD
ncbi:MAG: hypothetical protein K2J01_07920 [Clostridiales bacterium]|nr:hypothetical protein [Clostridiales bacterium]